jgi:hypothetical protein
MQGTVAGYRVRLLVHLYHERPASGSHAQVRLDTQNVLDSVPATLEGPARTEDALASGREMLAFIACAMLLAYSPCSYNVRADR